MAKSKTRGGAKSHRKRVQSRNGQIKGAQTKMQRMWQEEMTKKKKMIEDLNPPYSDTRGNKEVPSGYPKFVKGYIPEEGSTKEEKSFYQKLLRAIDNVAEFFGIEKKEVAEKDANRRLNKEMKK